MKDGSKDLHLKFSILKEQHIYRIISSYPDLLEVLRRTNSNFVKVMTIILYEIYSKDSKTILFNIPSPYCKGF